MHTVRNQDLLDRKKSVVEQAGKTKVSVGVSVNAEHNERLLDPITQPHILIQHHGSYERSSNRSNESYEKDIETRHTFLVSDNSL